MVWITDTGAVRGLHEALEGVPHARVGLLVEEIETLGDEHHGLPFRECVDASRGELERTESAGGQHALSQGINRILARLTFTGLAHLARAGRKVGTCRSGRKPSNTPTPCG